MAPVNRLDAMRASLAPVPHRDHESPDDESLELDDFEAEMKRLSAVNQELMQSLHSDDEHVESVQEPMLDSESEDLAFLRTENAELKARIQELEALGSGQSEELWLERQREYEMLLEEKTEVIRSLHQKMQEVQESAIGGEGPPVSSVGASGTKLGQAEEILRLKRELEEQRRQLDQDENDMMGQMRQMELTMAKERAEMARQRQDVQRQQAELTREIENSGRDPELRERLHNLRRSQDPKQTPAPMPIPAVNPTPPSTQKSSGLLRRIFG